MSNGRKHRVHELRTVSEQLEREARRIAHELHDEAGQMLVAVYLAVARVAHDVPAARERLERIPALLDQVSEHLRRLSHELRPIILDDLGLVPALEFLAQGVSQRTGLVISVESFVPERLPPAIEIALYRVVQEALTNVRKHARASRATIRLERNAHIVTGSIEDDGVGVDTSTVACKAGGRGLGLIGIRERLENVGGTLSIRSTRGVGTTLEFRVPADVH